MIDFLGLSLSTTGALGTLSLLLAITFVLYALIGGCLAGLRGNARFENSVRVALGGNFLFMTIALFALEYAILKDDFSVRYVAQHSMTVSPLWVKFVTLWAALEGSILLWAWILSFYAALVAWVARRDVLRPWVLTIMSVSLLFFVGLNLTVVNPFTPVAEVLTQGKGPNPLLQNHWMMAVHPVLMYFGFVGLSVPFAYALAALVTGRLGESWLIQTRRWTLIAWGFLTVAIVSGGWWSYEILGWGGYWAWDPVENASFIPWLLATAFLHSVQIQERRRILKGWNIYLIVFAYAATVLGTFLTRSGVVESVHAFGTGPVGMLFLGFFSLLVALGAGLATWRLPQIRDPAGLDRHASREGVLLAGNVIFVVFATLIVIATLFPIMIEAIRGFRTVVGPTFYNQFAIPLGLMILLAMGLGTLFPWRRLSDETWAGFWRLVQFPVLSGLVAALIGFLFGIRNIGLLLTLLLGIFNLVGLGQLVWQAITARRSAGKRDGLLILIRENPRRYGAYIAHVGVVMMSIGIGVSSTYTAKEEVTLNMQQPKTIFGKTVSLMDLQTQKLPEKVSKIATLHIEQEQLQPRLNNYVNMPQEIAMPAVRYHFIEDTYVTLLSADVKERWVTVAIIKTPLVSLIWWGTLVLMIGTYISFNAPIAVRRTK